MKVINTEKTLCCQIFFRKMKNISINSSSDDFLLSCNIALTSYCSKKIIRKQRRMKSAKIITKKPNNGFDEGRPDHLFPDSPEEKRSRSIPFSVEIIGS
jgi:hypothetical protein